MVQQLRALTTLGEEPGSIPHSQKDGDDHHTFLDHLLDPLHVYIKYNKHVSQLASIAYLVQNRAKWEERLNRGIAQKRLPCGYICSIFLVVY